MSPRVLAGRTGLLFVAVLLSIGVPLGAADCEGQPAGDVDFLTAICSEADLERVSIPSSRAPVDLAGKYIVPASDDPELLATVFQNVGRYALHQEFLRGAFPDDFGDLTLEEYTSLVERRATRKYYVGVISRLQTDAGTKYGFNVIVDESTTAELLSQEEVKSVYDRLKECFKLEPLVYFPTKVAEIEAAQNFAAPGFEIFIDDGPPLEYEPYTRAVGFGRVRLLDRENFELANERGQVSFQSIFVLDFSPRDIEGVLAGVITGAQQGELAHLSIRTARRGTPNAFVRNAHDVFREFEDKLVRLEVTATEATMREATVEEAEAFWASNRPTLAVTPQLDTEWGELSSFEEIVAQEQNGELVVPRFGGKASNLARLAAFFQDNGMGEYSEIGFAIPVRYYLEFVRSNRMPSFLDAEREVTYEEYINELMVDPEFLSDPEVRFQALDDLRDHMRDEGVVDPELLQRVISRVAEIFGTPTTRRVRFRSSSNVEDSVEFNGAGLYNSTSGCPQDDLDDDEEGPSHCDATRLEERTVARALKRVWRSLWNFRAHEERSFFSISHEITAMGILVNRTFIDEESNGVAFTGNPNNGLDRRFVVTSQPGEESVVSPEPGVLPEKVFLVIEDGQVKEIVRSSPSSLVEPGEVVMTDEKLTELGNIMAFMDANFPISLGDVPRSQVLLDMEVKVMPDGELVIKQVRPFLLPEPPPPETPTFALEIPQDSVLCAAFGVAGAGRGIRDEYELKSQLRLRGGTIPLPTDEQEFEAELFEEIRFGPAQDLAEALEPGRFRVLSFTGGGVTRYRFTYAQPFMLPDGRRLDVEIVSPITFRGDGSEALDPPFEFDEALFTKKPGNEVIQARLDGDPLVRYGSCTYELLPPEAVEADLVDGTKIRIFERFTEAESLLDTAPAGFIRADVTIDGQTHTVTDYWRLVYSAFRHNTFPTYWIFFDAPVAVDGIGEVHGVELVTERPPERPAQAAYFGADLSILKTANIQGEVRRIMGGEPPSGVQFRRGDVGGDGRIQITDAIAVLGHVFRRETISCRKAADANDDGRVNLVDALDVLNLLFRDGDALPEPTAGCGEDPTEDGLSCETPEACL